MKELNKKYIVSFLVGSGLLASVTYGYSVFNNPERLMNKSIEAKDYKKLVSVYNDKIINSEYEDYYNNKIYHIISDMMNEYEQDHMQYHDVVSSLNYFTHIHNSQIMNISKDHIDYLSIEGLGESLYKDASLYLHDKDYKNALMCISKIDKNYSDYNLVEDLYNKCIDELLVYTHQAQSEEEYKNHITLLETCYEYTNNDILLDQKSMLEKDMIIFINVHNIIEQAKSLYANESYKDSFDRLYNGLIEYPDNQYLNACLSHYHDLYISSITQKCNERLDNKDYEMALSIVNDANHNHPCQEFEDLIKVVKQKQNPFYPITDFFSNLFK